jgi:hypothetical protein
MATTAQLTENSRQGFEPERRACIWLDAELSRNLRWGWRHAYDETPADLAVYVRNDPVNKIDRDGRRWVWIRDSSRDVMGSEGMEIEGWREIWELEEIEREPGGDEEQKPECFAQLKYREVYANIPGTQKQVLVGFHAYWWVQSTDQTHYIIEGMPADYTKDGEKVQFLESSGPAQGDVKGTSDAINNNLAFEIPLSSGACDTVESMLAAARNFPTQTIPYSAFAGPNSNSYARYIGDVAGVVIPNQYSILYTSTLAGWQMDMMMWLNH